MRRPGDIERLYDEHAPSLFAFLLNFTRNESETRDLLQEIFVKIAREPDLLQKVRNERAYLIRLARNSAVDSIRRRDSRDRAKENVAVEQVSIFAPAADPDEELFRNELSLALKDLPEEQGTVAYLKLWEGLTFEEIADVLDISANTAASRYRYALDKLRERLRPLYKEITNVGP
jgi:RNA polymerase sigma-70 factor (ECF subfamily)